MASVDEVPRGGAFGFGAVALNQHGSRVFTLRNVGGGVLSISKLLVQGGEVQLAVALDDPGATSLAPGAATTFTVTYAPTATGEVADAISIVTNDVNGDYTFTVTGTGVRAIYGVTLLPSAYRALARRAPAG